MRIAPYGYRSVITTAIVCTALFAGGIALSSAGGTALWAASAIYLLFSLYFYRDPERRAPDENGIILAPADGKILLKQTIDHPIVGPGSTLVSIFMSPFNVHVNRIPASGKIIHLQYHPGKFLMAFDHQSMHDNERMEIGIDCRWGTIWFSQVSGFLARRIVCSLGMGEAVTTGNRFGMIKFGSRVDIILPASAEVTVSPGMKTVAGETVLARFNPV